MPCGTLHCRGSEHCGLSELGAHYNKHRAMLIKFCNILPVPVQPIARMITKIQKKMENLPILRTY